MELAVGFPVWHLGRDLLARHLAPSVSYGLLVEALGLFLLLAPRRPDFLAVGGCPVLGLEEGLEEVYGHRQDDGGVLVYRYLPHRLEEPELQRRRALQPVRGLPEALRCLILPLRRYYLRPTLPLALGLPGHRPLHLRRDLYVLHLNHADLYPPGIGLPVYDPLQLFVYGFPVGQEVVEVLLAEDAAQGGLAYLAGSQDV